MSRLDTDRDRIKQYFEQEYQHLQIAGERFVERHKTLGSKLKLTEREHKDPFVERLYEGFAFLAGRIHERLDDDLPEFTGGMLELLFPQMLRPFPSCSILEAKPRPGALSKPVYIPRGSKVQAGRLKVQRTLDVSGQARFSEREESAEFIFRTTQELIVHPFRLEAVRVEEIPNGYSTLSLQFQLERNVSYDALELRKLRLFLYGQHSMKYNLLMALTKNVKSIALREVRNDVPITFQEISDCRVGVAGLMNDIDDETEEFSILPYAKQTFDGYRLLQEYFAFPERFFFVDIDGLDQFRSNSKGSLIEIRLVMKGRISRERIPRLENIRLHCAPIVNLFDDSPEPVPVTNRLPEYPIIPNRQRRWSREVYAITSVVGVGENKQTQFQYLPVSSYDVLDTTSATYASKRFYSIMRRTAAQRGMAETSIRLFGQSIEREVFPKETLSLSAIMSNGFHPGELEVGTIKETLSDEIPQSVTVANLTKPTPMLECPDQKNYLWMLIAHLNVNYSTLANAETLRTLLNLYNWQPSDSHPNKKKIQSITKIHPLKSMPQREAVRGVELKMEVEPQAFENGDGDVYLFGTILNRFLTQYTSINSAVSLAISSEAGNPEKELRWQPKVGKILPL